MRALENKVNVKRLEIPFGLMGNVCVDLGLQK